MREDMIFGLRFDGEGAIRNAEAVFARFRRLEEEARAGGGSVLAVDFDMRAFEIFQKHLAMAREQAEETRAAFASGKLVNPLGTLPAQAQRGAENMGRDMAQLAASYNKASGVAEHLLRSAPAFNKSYLEGFLRINEPLRQDAGGYARGQKQAIRQQPLSITAYSTEGVEAAPRGGVPGPRWGALQRNYDMLKDDPTAKWGRNFAELAGEFYRINERGARLLRTTAGRDLAETNILKTLKGQEEAMLHQAENAKIGRRDISRERYASIQNDPKVRQSSSYAQSGGDYFSFGGGRTTLIGPKDQQQIAVAEASIARSERMAANAIANAAKAEERVNKAKAAEAELKKQRENLSKLQSAAPGEVQTFGRTQQYREMAGAYYEISKAGVKQVTNTGELLRLEQMLNQELRIRQGLPGIERPERVGASGGGSGGSRGGGRGTGDFGEEFARGFRGRADHSYAEQLGQTAKISLLYGGAYRVLSAVEQTFSAAFEQAVEFQRGLTDLSLATGRPTEELKGLGEKIAQIAASTGAGPFGALEAANKAIGQYGLTGAPRAEQDLAATEAARSSSQLALLSGKTAAEIQQQLGAATTNLKLGPSGQQYVADLDTYFTQKFGTARGSTLETVARTGALGTTAGFSPAELSALAADIQARTGQTDSAVAGYLDTIIARGGNAGFEQKIAGFGIDITKGFRDQLLEISTILPTLGDKQREELLGLFGKGPTKEAAGVVTGSFPSLVEEAKKAEAGAAGGATQRAADAQLKNLGSQLKVFREDVDLLARHIGETGLLDALGLVVKSVDFVVKSLDPLVSLFAGLPGPIHATVAALGVLLVATKASTIRSAGSSIAGALLPGVAASRAVTSTLGTTAAVEKVAAPAWFSAVKAGVADPSAGLASTRAALNSVLSPTLVWTGAIIGVTAAIGAGIRAHQEYEAALHTVAELRKRPDSSTVEGKRAQADELRAGAVTASAKAQGGAGRSFELGGQLIRHLALPDWADVTDPLGYMDRTGKSFNTAQAGTLADAARLANLSDAQQKAEDAAAKAGSSNILELVAHNLEDTATASDTLNASFVSLKAGGHSSAEAMSILGDAIIYSGKHAKTASAQVKARELEDALHKQNLAQLPGGDFGVGQLKELQRSRKSIISQLETAPGDLDNIKNLADANQAIVDLQIKNFERVRKAAQRNDLTAKQLANTTQAAINGEIAAAAQGGSAEQLAGVIGTFGDAGITAARAYLAGVKKSLATISKKIAQEKAVLAIGEPKFSVVPVDTTFEPAPATPPRESIFNTDTTRGVKITTHKATIAKALTEDEKQAKLLRAIATAFGQALGTIAADLSGGQIAALTTQANISPGDSLGQAGAAVTVAKANLDKVRHMGLKSQEYLSALQAYNQAVYGYAQAQGQDADVLVQIAAARTGGPIAAAEAQLQIATNQLNRAKGAAERHQAELAIIQANDAIRQAYLDKASVLRQLHGDITNPVENARDALADARAKLAKDVGSHKGSEVINADRLDVRQKGASLAKTKFDQDMSDEKTKYELGQISFAAFQRYLVAQRNHLLKIKHRSRDEVNELFATEQELKGLANQLQGQFNLGDIKLPTVYQVRRAIGGDGASAIPKTQIIRSQVELKVDASPAALKLLTLLGPQTTVNSTHHRKV